MAPGSIRIAVAASAVAIALGACGGGDGDDLVDEADLRECLTDSGLSIAPPAPVGAFLGSASPDFRAIGAGEVGVYVMVEKSDAAAERTAADLRGVLLSVGSGDREVTASRNVVTAEDGDLAEPDREQVDACIDEV